MSSLWPPHLGRINQLPKGDPLSKRGRRFHIQISGYVYLNETTTTKISACAPFRSLITQTGSGSESFHVNKYLSISRGNRHNQDGAQDLQFEFEFELEVAFRSSNSVTKKKRRIAKKGNNFPPKISHCQVQCNPIDFPRCHTR